MILEQLEVGPFTSNCYIVGCPETKKAAVIDPGAEGNRILRQINQTGLQVEVIINTHGHIDHVGANREVSQATGAEILIHREDAGLMQNPGKSLALFAGARGVPAPNRLLADGDEISVGTISFKVIHTPGHTPGGICLLADGKLFCGDTLFAGSIGRTDLPGGSFEALIQSIKEKLLVLPAETEAYPGHGPATTIGSEARHNPFLI